MNHDELSLERHLVLSGLGNRRECAKLIRDGKVTLNGKVVRDSKKIVPADSKVKMGSRELSPAPLKIYLLHKPPGYVCQTGEEAPPALELLPPDMGLSLVGRLDKESEGLIMATNDGDLAHRLTHPDHGIAKTYRVAVTPRLDTGTLARLCSGLPLDGTPTQPLKGRILSHKDSTSHIELELREGKKRQIRRLCEAVGRKVLRLERLAIGPVKLGNLAPGSWREATTAERRILEGDSGF
ncbi:MAG: pseudouridine synthase [Planctomycetota bacterium]